MLILNNNKLSKVSACEVYCNLVNHFNRTLVKCLLINLTDIVKIVNWDDRVQDGLLVVFVDLYI